jgi:hypothetical protein
MSNIYLMYSLWLLTGIVLVSYLIYRRKRKAFVQPLKPIQGVDNSPVK